MMMMMIIIIMWSKKNNSNNLNASNKYDKLFIRRRFMGRVGEIQTRMVQLPATAAIEYVAAGHFSPEVFWRQGLLAGGIFVRGCFCPGGLLPGGLLSGGLMPVPPSSMRIRTV